MHVWRGKGGEGGLNTPSTYTSPPPHACMQGALVVPLIPFNMGLTNLVTPPLMHA